MIDIKNIQSVYFIGIGGIGMSALARYFNEQGVSVSGYDRTRTPLTADLEAAGISVCYEDDLSLAPKGVNLVVYTPAIPKDHQQWNFYKDNGYIVAKRSEVLEAITNNSFNICIAGTHGKTTISTLVGHLLRHSNYGCNAFLGGIAVNYNSNFWSSRRNVVVVEADEYDRSFLKLTPNIAVISAMDADHLDIYGTAAAMENAFIEFAGKIKEGGVLFSKYGLKRKAELKAPVHFTYSLRDHRADVYVKQLETKNGCYRFDVQGLNWEINGIELNIGGLHNVENATVAIAIAKHLGVEDESIKAAVSAFKGVKRRFEYIIAPNAFDTIVFIDDYAHHPEELRALITSARGLFPEHECLVVFQPHLFSRTRDLAEGFALSLDMADEVILLPIYPARELPIEGVSSEMITGYMHNPNHSVKTKEELIEYLKQDISNRHQPTVLITAGAGDIDTLLSPIRKMIEQID